MPPAAGGADPAAQAVVADIKAALDAAAADPAGAAELTTMREFSGTIGDDGAITLTLGDWTSGAPDADADGAAPPVPSAPPFGG